MKGFGSLWYNDMATENSVDIVSMALRPSDIQALLILVMVVTVREICRTSKLTRNIPRNLLTGMALLPPSTTTTIKGAETHPQWRLKEFRASREASVLCVALFLVRKIL